MQVSPSIENNNNRLFGELTVGFIDRLMANSMQSLLLTLRLHSVPREPMLTPMGPTRPLLRQSTPNGVSAANQKERDPQRTGFPIAWQLAEVREVPQTTTTTTTGRSCRTPTLHHPHSAGLRRAPQPHSGIVFCNRLPASPRVAVTESAATAMTLAHTHSPLVLKTSTS